MTASNVAEYEAQGYKQIAAVTSAAAEAVRADPESLLTMLQQQQSDSDSDSDQSVVADRGGGGPGGRRALWRARRPPKHPALGDVRPVLGLKAWSVGLRL